MAEKEAEGAPLARVPPTHGEVATWAAARDCIFGGRDDACGAAECVPCRVRESLPDLKCFCGKYILDWRWPSVYDRGLDDVVQWRHTPERCEPPPPRRLCPACQQTLPEGTATPEAAPPEAFSVALADLREARRLREEARWAVASGIGTHGEECRSQRTGEGDCVALTNMRATLKALDAFGERSDREQSSPPAPPEDAEERK